MGRSVPVQARTLITRRPQKARPVLSSALYDAAFKRCQVVRVPGAGSRCIVHNPLVSMLSAFEPHVKLADIPAGAAFEGGVAFCGALLWEG